MKAERNDSQHAEIKAALKPVRRRVRLVRRVANVCWALLAAFVGVGVTLLVSYFIPISTVWVYMLYAGGGAFLLTALCLELRPLPISKTARIADGLGLRERAVTMLELQNRDDTVSVIQREDALLRLASLKVKEKLPLKPARPPLIASGAAVAMILCSLVIPNPQTEIMKSREALQNELKAQVEQLNNRAERETPGLSEPESQELKSLIKDYTQKLEQATDKKEALKLMSQAEDKLEELKKQVSDRMKREAAEALSKSKATEEYAKALGSNSIEGMEAAIEKMSKLENEEMEELSEALSEAAEELKDKEDNEAIENKLEEAALSASMNSSGIPIDLNMSLSPSAISDALSAQLANLNALSQLMSLSKSGLTKVQSASSATGQGQGEGQAQGNSPSQGGGGSSAGTGSTQQDAGYKPYSSSGSQGVGTKVGDASRIGEFERIYDPRLLGGDSQASQVGGVISEGGDSLQVELGPGLGMVSGEVPYIEVIGDYEQGAALAMERDGVPPGMQSWVEQYFSSLTQ